jgi:hypothetical protein
MLEIIFALQKLSIRMSWGAAFTRDKRGCTARAAAILSRAVAPRGDKHRNLYRAKERLSWRQESFLSNWLEWQVRNIDLYLAILILRSIKGLIVQYLRKYRRLRISIPIYRKLESDSVYRYVEHQSSGLSPRCTEQ